MDHSHLPAVDAADWMKSKSNTVK